MTSAESTVLQQVVQALRPDSAQVAQLMAREIARQLPQLSQDAEMEGALLASCRSNIDLSLEVAAGDRPLPKEAPPAAHQFTRIGARLGIPIGVALQSYRIGHALTWQRWLATARELFDGDELLEAIQAGSAFMFEYVDHISALVSEIYSAELEASRRGREQLSLELVQSVLAMGSSADPKALAGLDYQLDQWHIAAIVSGGDSQGATIALATATGATASLVVPLGAGLAWAWAGYGKGARPRPPKLIRGLPEGTAISLGEPAAGAGGFKSSHDQSAQAHRVAAITENDFTRYRDVALTALALSDPGGSELFVDSELAQLAGSDSRSSALRQTLAAWFATGQNASSASAILNVHENTVLNRLSEVERRIGQPAATRRAELEVALRLFELRAQHKVGG